MDYYPDTMVVYFQRSHLLQLGFLICIRFLSPYYQYDLYRYKTDGNDLPEKAGWDSFVHLDSYSQNNYIPFGYFHIAYSHIKQKNQLSIPG